MNGTLQADKYSPIALGAEQRCVDADACPTVIKEIFLEGDWCLRRMAVVLGHDSERELGAGSITARWARMHIRVHKPLVSLLLAGTLALPTPVLADRSDCRELAVGHFEVFSTLDDSGTRNVARQLQAFEQTLGEMLQTGDRLPDTPTRIYVLGDRDFNQYAAFRPGLGGFFQEGRFQNVMVVNADKPFDIVRVALFHEFVHFIQRNTGTQRFPPWFMEGYAELFSGFQLKGNKLLVGGLPYGVASNWVLWIPVERLLAVKQNDPEYQNETLAPQFYAESWLLVHLLLFDDKALNAPTLRYLEYMDNGFPESEAFSRAFPFDKSALEQRLRDFMGARAIHMKEVTLPRALIFDKAPLTRLTPAQADTELTRMIWQLNKPKAIIDELAAKVAAERPSDPSARALIARIAAHQGDPTSVDDLVVSLAKGGVDNPQVRIDVADALVHANRDSTANRQALAILGDLLQLDVPPVEAVELWAIAAGRTGVNAAQIAVVLEPLLVRVPHDTAVLQSLAHAYEAMGDKAKSRNAYNQIILVSHSPEERHWAQQQADSARLQESATPRPQ